MALSAMCLLALVAVSAAYGPPPPPPPPRCYSDVLKQHFSIGETLTAPGCVQLNCVDGKISETACKPVSPLDAGRPSARCRSVAGPADADYPDCCPTAVCDQCYSEELDQVFDDGAVWTESGCTQLTCVKGDIQTLRCPVEKPAPGCRMEDGAPGAQYPACCPQVVCPRPDQCYSADLDKVFDDGQVWSVAPCAQNTCVNGKVVTKECEPVTAGPYCEVQEGTPGAPFPACCSAVACTDPPAPTSAPTGY